MTFSAKLQMGPAAAQGKSATQWRCRAAAHADDGLDLMPGVMHNGRGRLSGVGV